MFGIFSSINKDIFRKCVKGQLDVIYNKKTTYEMVVRLKWDYKDRLSYVTPKGNAYGNNSAFIGFLAIVSMFIMIPLIVFMAERESVYITCIISISYLSIYIFLILLMKRYANKALEHKYYEILIEHTQIRIDAIRYDNDIYKKPKNLDLIASDMIFDSDFFIWG